jgi:hypothetical protein
MNSRSEKNMRENKSINIISYIFIGLLGIQAIIEFTLGGMLLFNFQATLESAFEITYTSQLDILGIALGLYLILLTTLILLSIYWTVKKNTAGPVI